MARLKSLAMALLCSLAAGGSAEAASVAGPEDKAESYIRTARATLAPLVPPVPSTAARGGFPEPATWAMLLVGFGSLGLGMRIARHRAVREE